MGADTLLPVVAVDSLPTDGTVSGGMDPLEAPLGVPDKTEPAVPAGMFGSLICAMAPTDIIKSAQAKVAALKILLMVIPSRLRW